MLMSVCRAKFSINKGFEVPKNKIDSLTQPLVFFDLNN